MAPDPTAVDGRVQARNLSLAGLRDPIPEHCRRPSELRSFMTLARVLVSMAICLWLLASLELTATGWWWQAPALVALWVVYGWVLLGAFVIGHECGHYAFSRVRWINHAVGYLCMSPLWNSFHTWRITHDHHHRKTQLRGQEVDWAANLVTQEELDRTSWRSHPITRLGYTMPFGILLWIMVNTLRRALAVRSMIEPSRYDKERRALLVSNAMMVLGLVGVYGGLFAYFGLWGVIKYHAAPATVTMLTGSLILTIQHANEGSILYSEAGWSAARGQIASTFDVRFPRPLEWLWCKINIHIPHHLLPSVPWYHLEEASRAIRAAHPELYQEYRFSPAAMMWMRRTPLLWNEGDHFRLKAPGPTATC